ncbi:MAG: hypothetical protein JJ902_00520 [Roseibium sp.]|nr:hypothetical protein [Roseibium sp.]
MNLSTIEDRLNEIFRSVDQLNANQGANVKETLSHLDRISNYHIDLSNELIRRADSINIHTHMTKERQQIAAMNSITDFETRCRDPKSLSRSYAQVYSQFGEDGYIAEIFSRIGEKTRTFLEIGVENGTQNTTRFLLERGWSGVWIEGDEQKSKEAGEIFQDFIVSGQSKIIQIFVEPDNINQILDSNNAAMIFDYISVDVDQNTSHVWRALDRTARVACIEYNASIPPSVAVEVPYQAGAAWDGTNHFGASLKTLDLIGKTKGMSLVGCDFPGVNAFFVTDGETGDAFRQPYDAMTHYEPPRYSALNHLGHPPAATAKRWSHPRETG